MQKNKQGVLKEKNSFIFISKNLAKTLNL